MCPVFWELMYFSCPLPSSPTSLRHHGYFLLSTAPSRIFHVLLLPEVQLPTSRFIPAYVPWNSCWVHSLAVGERNFLTSSSLLPSFSVSLLSSLPFPSSLSFQATRWGVGGHLLACDYRVCHHDSHFAEHTLLFQPLL